jgi:tetratricopeptide (TPR) repeat protein
MFGMRWALVALAMLAGTPARAEWMRAETKHFIVYENAREAEVKALASDLERFDGFVRLFHSTREVPGAEANKLTVYVVPDVAAVQRLCGKCPNVYGFYNGRASGSVAFTPRSTPGGARDNSNMLGARTVLFHEYGHHLLLGGYALAYPAWFSEGYAEFVSTMRIAEKVTIGAAAQHRAHALLSAPRLPATALFDPQSRKKLNAMEVDVLYGRGWLLTHWIMFDKDRRGRFQRYLTALNSGTPSLKAATDAFGDLKALDRELDRYLNQSTIPAMILDRSEVSEPVVTVASLSLGAQDMIAMRLVSTRGVDHDTALSLYRKAAPVAARYPDDPVAQGWFAEIAADAGETEAANQAVARALGADPKSAQALTYAAILGMRVAAKSKAAADWDAARKAIIRANRADPDRAQPLVLFYSSFEAQGTPPRKSAIDGLYRAQELAPQDSGVRILAARQLIRDNNLTAARRMLAPLAFDPHAPADNPGSKAIARLDAGDGPGALGILSGEDKTAGEDSKAKPKD